MKKRADTLQNNNDVEGAIKLYIKIIEKETQLFGDKHHDTLATMSSLSDCFKKHLRG